MPVMTVSHGKAYRSDEIMEMYGIGRTRMYELMKTVITYRLGRYKVIPESELRKFEESVMRRPETIVSGRKRGRKQTPPIFSGMWIGPDDPRWISL